MTATAPELVLPTVEELTTLAVNLQSALDPILELSYNLGRADRDYDAGLTTPYPVPSADVAWRLRQWAIDAEYRLDDALETVRGVPERLDRIGPQQQSEAADEASR